MILLSLRVGRWPMLAAGPAERPDLGLFSHSRPGSSSGSATCTTPCWSTIYLVVALVAGQLAAAQIRAQARKERIREESEKLTRTLLDSVSHELAHAPRRHHRGWRWKISTTRRRRSRPAWPAKCAPPPTAAEPALVRNLLDQTRLESGTLQPRMEWCDARDSGQCRGGRPWPTRWRGPRASTAGGSRRIAAGPGRLRPDRACPGPICCSMPPFTPRRGRRCALTGRPRRRRARRVFFTRDRPRAPACRPGAMREPALREILPRKFRAVRRARASGFPIVRGFAGGPGRRSRSPERKIPTAGLPSFAR